MKKIYYLGLLWVLFGTSVTYAQDPVLDSLKLLIDNGADDTLKVIHLNQYSINMLGYDPVKAIDFAQKAQLLADKLSYGRGIAYALKHIGLGYYYQGEYLSVMEYWNTSLKTFESISDTTGIANLVNNLGSVYYTQGSDSKAIEFYLRSLRISEKLQDTLRIATALYNIAGVYANKPQDYSKAFEFLWRALPLGKTLNDPSITGSCASGLGELHIYQEDYDSARYYFDMSLALAYDVPHSLNKLGLVYLKMQNYDSALYFQNKSLQLGEEKDQKLDMALALLGIGDTYNRLNSNEKALESYRQAEEIAKKSGLNDELKDIYKGMASSYAGTGNFERAYYFHNLFSELKDTLFDIATDDKIRGLQFTYEIDIREDQIQLLEKETEIEQLKVKRQKVISAAIGLGGFLILILLIGLFQRFRFVRRTNNIIERERNRSENLLLNILPEETAEELKENGSVKAKRFDSATVLFTDFKGFTKYAENLPPEELVKSVDYYFRRFDGIIEKHGLEKIKTIGDAYMCAGGLPFPNPDHPKMVVAAALELAKFVEDVKSKNIEGIANFDIRIGIHTGPVVAGVVGIKKFAYDIWGDTVNIAARMESNSVPGRVNISESTYQAVNTDYECTLRGELEAKNRGMLKMYFVEGKHKRIDDDDF